MTDFCETWYKYHVIGSYPTFMLFNSLPSIITTWRMSNRLWWKWY